LVVLAGCRQGDDVVATLKALDSGSPPLEDVAVPPPDTSIEPDAPPVTMDVEVPRPDVPVDVVVPPPMDVTPPQCEATGPVLSIRRVNGEASQSCAGQLAAHTFTHALCACGDLNFAALLSTVSFDSSTGETPVSAGAPVGVGGTYPTARSNIGGSLTIAGTAATTVSAGLDVQGDLRLAGNATFWNQLSVKRDTWLVSGVTYWAIVNIGGDLLTNAPSGSFQGIGPTFVGGRQIVKSFTVNDPCHCADRLDIAEMVRIGVMNTDSGQPIAPTALINVTTATDVILPCGRFQFNSIGGPGPLRVTITGRTAIFVEGNVSLSDSFALDIAPGAELDWFIRGNLSIGAAEIGDTNRPSATRIYVGGSDDIVLSSGEIGANIYAPNTNVNLASLGLEGSIYGKNLNMIGGGIVRYDRAILKAGDNCTPTTTCGKQCNSCNGASACRGGVCGKCVDDEDCCAPLVCVQEACRPLLFQ
jgi:hypothetical protein